GREVLPALHAVPGQPDERRPSRPDSLAVRRRRAAAHDPPNDHRLPVMDIALRAIFLYAFVVFVIRVLGRRELSSLGAVDLVLLIVLGDAIQQGLTQDDYSV